MEIIKLSPPYRGEFTAQSLAPVAKIKHPGQDVEFHLHEDDNLDTGAYRAVVVTAAEADAATSGKVFDLKRVELNGDTTETRIAC